MNEAMALIGTGTLGLAGLSIAAVAALKGWQGWLDLKRLELAGTREQPRPSAIERIELADLRERVRSLETIAAGVNL